MKWIIENYYSPILDQLNLEIEDRFNRENTNFLEAIAEICLNNKYSSLNKQSVKFLAFYF